MIWVAYFVCSSKFWPFSQNVLLLWTSFLHMPHSVLLSSLSYLLGSSFSSDSYLTSASPSNVSCRRDARLGTIWPSDNMPYHPRPRHQGPHAAMSHAHSPRSGSVRFLPTANCKGLAGMIRGLGSPAAVRSYYRFATRMSKRFHA